MCSKLRLGIGRITEQHNTALYFERAARAAGYEVTVVQDPANLAQVGPLDLFLVVDPWFYGLQDLPGLSCPTAVVLIDVHRDVSTRTMFSRFCDHAFVAQRDLVSDIASSNHSNVHWLPLAGDPNLHFVPNVPRDIDVGFVGKIGTLGTDRHTVLSNVLGQFSTNEIGRHYTPSEMGEVYSRSRIVLNKSIGGDVNMRVFEALAAGALLITDRIENGLNDLLNEGEHYVGYDTAEGAVAQIQRYLANEDARARIAGAGQNVLRERHTYDARFAQIIKTVQSSKTLTAPARHAHPSQRRLWRAEWARSRGISFADAVSLVAEGLSPAGYADLSMGLARYAKWMMTGARV